MAKEINDYLTIADNDGLLNFVEINAEGNRSLEYNVSDLKGTVDSEGNKGIEEDPPLGPSI